MSCNGCAKKFTVFKSERGCPGCGFGYCSKCLEHSIFVKKFNKVAKVCYKCKMADEKGNEAGPSEIEPPKAYLRRLESLENPSRPPITVYQTNDRLQRLKKGLSQEDYQIAERLEKLREDRKKGPLPSDNEIKERLAKLRGESIEISSKSNIPAADTRTDQQKCDDLLSQYMDETVIEEGRSNIDKEIQERINVLKGIPPNASNIPQMSTENLSDEEMAERLLSQILSKMSDDELSDQGSDKSAEEMSEKSSDEAMSEDSTSDEDSLGNKKKTKK